MLNLGAIKTSKNSLLKSFAVFKSTSALQTKTPPNAEIGSLIRALLYAKERFFFVEIPQALLCFKIANVGFAVLNSEIRLIALSISSRLLYDNCLP